MNKEIINAMKLIDEEIIAESESNIESDVKAINKIMLFGYNDVHKLVL